MTKKNPIYLTVILVVASIVLTFQLTMIATDGYSRLFRDDSVVDSTTDTTVLSEKTLEKLKEIALRYAAFFPGEIDEATIEEYLISAFISGAGDKFGTYVNAADLEDYLKSIEGSFKGIGVSVIYDATYGGMEIVSVFPDSPAERAGILCGDIVAYVGIGENRQSVHELGYYKALDLIRGEEGTNAEFVVIRGGSEIEFSVERGEVTNQTVYLHMYEFDSRVAVIRITQFEKITVEQFKKALDDAKAAGAEAYVFDLRSNPGGELNTIVSILDMLLPKGPIIRIEYKNSSNNVQLDSDESFLDAPMAVLCNGSTASAGELFCAALKDYEAATLVGTQTYGKGTMQTLLPLSDGSALSMTVAYYLPPYSENYHGVGVTPDIVCKISDELANVNLHKYTDANDNQLAEAVKALGLSSLG